MGELVGDEESSRQIIVVSGEYHRIRDGFIGAWCGQRSFSGQAIGQQRSLLH
jgi:hypothetical protein